MPSQKSDDDELFEDWKWGNQPEACIPCLVMLGMGFCFVFYLITSHGSDITPNPTTATPEEIYLELTDGEVYDKP